MRWGDFFPPKIMYPTLMPHVEHLKPFHPSTMSQIYQNFMPLAEWFQSWCMMTFFERVTPNPVLVDFNLCFPFSNFGDLYHGRGKNKHKRCDMFVQKLQFEGDCFFKFSSLNCLRGH